MTGTTTSDSKGKESNNDKADTPQSQNSKAEVTEENFRPEYVAIENKCANESETLHNLEVMKQRLTALEEGKLSKDHSNYLLATALPKITKAFLKHRFMDDDLCVHVNKFFKHVCTVIVDTIPTNNTALLGTLIQIFDNDCHFYLSRGKREDEPEELSQYATYPTTNKWASYFLLENINHFGRKGGFDALIKHMRSDNPKVPLNVLAQMLEVFWMVQYHGYWVTSKIQYFAGEVRNIVASLLLSFNTEELKAVKKEEYESVIKYTMKLLDVVFTSSTVGEYMEKMQLDVALKCFNSRIFDKRIFGLNYINEMIGMVRNLEKSKEESVVMAPVMMGTSLREPKWVDGKFMMEWLQKNHVLEEIFGKSAQQEVLKRSGDILSFYAKHNSLTPEHMEMIWRATTIHEAFHSIIMKVLGEFCADLQPSHIVQIYGYLKAIPRDQLTANYLTLIRDMGKSVSDSSQKALLTEMLWEILVGSNTPIEISSQALFYLQDVVKAHNFRHQRYAWISKALHSVKANHSVAFCYELIGTIIATFPPKPTTMESDCMVSITEKVEAEFHIIEAIFNELVLFKQEARSNFEKLHSHENANEKVLAGRLDYLNEVKYRLKFINFILGHYEEVIPLQFYELFWNQMIVGAITPQEADEAFEWLICGRKDPAEGFVALDDENAMYLFEKHMLQLNPSTLSPLAFKCFTRFCCDTNVKLAKMHWKDSTATAQQANQGPKEEFEVLDLQTLRGYDYVWDVVKDSQSADVIRDAMDFLIKLHGKVHPKYVQTYGKEVLRDHFIKLCVSHLEKASAVFGQQTADAERRIERMLTLLFMYCEQVEEETRTKAKSHGASTRGKPVTLHVVNAVAGTTPENFSLELHSNETILAVKQKIKDQLVNFQGAVTDLFLTLKKNQITEENKTLGDLNITNNATVEANCNQIIPKGQETVNRSRIKSNTKKTDAKPAPPDAADRAKQLVEIYSISQPGAYVALRKADWDLSNAAALLSDEYQTKEIIAEAEKLVQEEQEALTKEKTGGVDEMEVKRLPSYLLSHNQTYFNLLFELLNLKSDIISARVWSLLLAIPTSTAKLDSLYSVGPEAADDTSKAPDWKSLFDEKSAYKMLYGLQIVDSILFPLDESGEVTARATWTQAFLRKGGFQHLATLLTHVDWFAKKQLKESAEVSKMEIPPQQRSCLALILKVVDFFLGAMMKKTVDSTTSNSEASFSALISQLSASVAEKLLPTLDFATLLEKTFAIIHGTVSKQALDRDDQVVTAYGMRLVSICIQFDPTKYLPVFYKTPNLSHFLLLGIIQCQDRGVRVEFSDGLYRIASELASIHSSSFESPDAFLISFLLKNIPDHTTTDSNVWSACAPYFHLLERLIAIDCQKKKSASGYKDLALSFAQRIRERPIVETRGIEQGDEILTGMMSVLTAILVLLEDLRKELGQNQKMVFELYHNCLFAIRAGPNDPNYPKCKVRSSRLVAFQLLIEICRNVPDNFLQLLEFLKSHHIGGNIKINTWDYYPGSDDKSVTGYCGLRNLGNTCYINSLMQQFFMLPTMRYGMMLYNPGTLKTDTLLYQIQSIFAYLQESEKIAYEPVGFCQVYKDWEGRSINVHQQHDVDEFFNLLCQRLEQQLKGTPHEKLIASAFGGKICNEIRSVDPNYPYLSERDEDFFTVSLDIKGKARIEDALDAYVKADKLEGDNAFYCSQYERKIDVTKRCFIKKLDNSLILHLKRFEFDFTNYKKMKVNDLCEFPEFLNIKPWTKEGLALKEGREVDAEDKHPDWYYTYELMGVLVHSGGADGGHYYSYIKERIPNSKGERNWIEFNDKTTAPFDPKDLPSECFGGTQLVTHWDNWQRQMVKKTYDRIRNAYMLVYDRVQPEAVKIPLSITSNEEKKVSPSSSPLPDPAQPRPSMEPAPTRPPFEVSGQAVASSTTSTSPIAIPVAQVSESKEEAFFPTNTDTAYSQKVSAHINKILGSEVLISGIPAALYHEVWKENARFLRERQFFDPIYFEFMLNFFKLSKFPPNSLYEAEDPNDPAFQAIQMGTNFTLEIVAHAKDCDAIFHNWVQQLKSMLETHVPACRWFLSYLMANNLIKELVLECTNEKTRIAFADLVVHVLKIVGPHEYGFWFDMEEVVKESKPEKDSAKPGEAQVVNQVLVKQPKPVSVRFMDAVLGLLEESRSFWRRFKQYFLIVRDYALIGHRQREYLLSRGVITLYADYFMGRPKRGQSHRVSVMDRFNLPDLTEFISTISVLVRGCETGALKEKGYAPSTIKDTGPVLTMPIREKKELYDRTFFSSMLEMDYNPEGACEIVLHVCWEDMKRTKWVLEIIMGEVGKAWLTEKLPVFSNLLLPLLKLDDSLQSSRVSMAMTPFSAQGSIKGLLALIHDSHTQHAKFVVQLIRLLLHLCNNCKPVFQYVSKQKRELIWMEQFLESRMNSQEMENRHPLAGHSSDVEGIDDDMESGATKKEEEKKEQKKDITHLTFQAVKKFLSEIGVDEEPNHDKERELVEQLDEIKRENARLKDALEYYRKNAPEVKPPHFMTTKEWEENKIVKIDAKVEEAEEEEKGKSEIPQTMIETETLNRDNGLEEINTKAKTLLEIFGNIPLNAAKLALKKFDFDVETTAMYLSDETATEHIMREAAAMEERGESIDAVLMGEVKKKQRSPSADDATSNDTKNNNGKRNLRDSL